MALSEAINTWVEEQLERVPSQKIRDFKIIRDALLDTIRFETHEIRIMDLPIVQRLRRIAQTGLVYLTYPSATHNRFEHTLGVTAIATQFAEAIKDKENKVMDEETVREVRLAGILHDVGHGPFSHISERVYRSFPDVFRDIHEELETNPKFSKCKPHEMLSYLIVTSPCFRDFYKDNILPQDDRATADLDKVADIIVGDMENPSESYVSDIINGAFDADKLDYIPRDCYFTGLKMEVDIDRIMYTVSISKKKVNGRKGLIIDISGSPFVEQVLFNKMLLYTSIYHHQKVRTLECMLCSVFEVALDKNLEINGRSFKTVTDFLSVTDPDVLTLEGKPDEMKPYIENILNRTLLKRALVISKSTIRKSEKVSDEEGDEVPEWPYEELWKLRKNPKRIRDLRELIAQEASEELTPYDVWIDLPEPPSFRESSQTLIKITDKEMETLNNIIPIGKWLRSYAETKWRGHVFCPPQLEYRKKVNKAALRIFKQELNLEFNEFATLFAKIG